MPRHIKVEGSPCGIAVEGLLWMKIECFREKLVCCFRKKVDNITVEYFK